MPAATIANTIAATGFLYIAQNLFLFYNLRRQTQFYCCLALTVFLTYAVFWQSFDDLWECFFLLCGLRIFISESFVLRPALWFCAGCLGALAYFSKAYAFPFFMADTMVCVYLLTGKQWQTWLKITATVFATMFFLSLPWIILLHIKYGIWTTSTAGSLNMSWYLVGHPIYKGGIDMLVPAMYKDSPYFWEDPYLVNGPMPHFWSSWYLFGLQFLRILINLWKLLVSTIQLSVLFPAIGVLAVLLPFRRRLRDRFPATVLPLVASFIIFPLGYILINFEARYLWYLIPLSIILGQLAIEKITHQKLKFFFFLLLPFSFAVYPLLGLRTMFDDGKEQFDLAAVLKQAHISGTFTSNVHPRTMGRLAYFSGLQYVYNPGYDLNDDTILAAAASAGVTYYLRFYSRYQGDSYGFRKGGEFFTSNGARVSEVLNDQSERLIIYKLGPTNLQK